jgi:hypothetical protein
MVAWFLDGGGRLKGNDDGRRVVVMGADASDDDTVLGSHQLGA